MTLPALLLALVIVIVAALSGCSTWTPEDRAFLAAARDVAAADLADTSLSPAVYALAEDLYVVACLCLQRQWDVPLPPLAAAKLAEWLEAAAGGGE